MDSLLTSRQTGTMAEHFKVAETAAAARVFNQMYYLPTLLKQIEDHMAEMEAAKHKAANFQEQGGLQVSQFKEAEGIASKFLSDTIKERAERQRRSADAV